MRAIPVTLSIILLAFTIGSGCGQNRHAHALFSAHKPKPIANLKPMNQTEVRESITDKVIGIEHSEGGYGFRKNGEFIMYSLGTLEGKYKITGSMACAYDLLENSSEQFCLKFYADSDGTPYFSNDKDTIAYPMNPVPIRDIDCKSGMYCPQNSGNNGKGPFN